MDIEKGCMRPRKRRSLYLSDLRSCLFGFVLAVVIFAVQTVVATRVMESKAVPAQQYGRIIHVDNTPELNTGPIGDHFLGPKPDGSQLTSAGKGGAARFNKIDHKLRLVVIAAEQEDKDQYNEVRELDCNIMLASVTRNLHEDSYANQDWEDCFVQTSEYRD